MQTTQSIANLAEAMAKFQAAIKDPLKNAEANTGKYRFRYADLDSILKVIRPLLAENGLSFVQEPVVENGMVGVKTMLMHCTGEYIMSESFVMPSSKSDPQGYGGCITYAKRYSLAAILGISADEDDDANWASGNESAKITHATSKRQPQIDGVAKGAHNEAFVDTIRQKMVEKCQEKNIDMKYVAKAMSEKYKKGPKELTVGEYTDFYDNFDSYIQEYKDAGK